MHQLYDRLAVSLTFPFALLERGTGMISPTESKEFLRIRTTFLLSFPCNFLSYFRFHLIASSEHSLMFPAPFSPFPQQSDNYVDTAFTFFLDPSYLNSLHFTGLRVRPRP